MSNITRLLELEMLIDQARNNNVPEHEITLLLAESNDVRDQLDMEAINHAADMFNLIHKED